jgi:hypothetical protein
MGAKRVLGHKLSGYGQRRLMIDAALLIDSRELSQLSCRTG